MNPNDLRNIHPQARIGAGVQISPFVTIEADVEIGDGTWIGPGAVLMSGTRVGRNCKIFPGAVLGAVPQDLKFKGEESYLTLGDQVVVREYCTLNRGTEANHNTEIGSNTLLMAYVHVAHDCIIGKNCVLANNATLAGHIELGDHAILGGMVAVHQFVRIGRHVMVGGGSLVRKDVPPFVKAAREPLSYAGINSIGLKRRGFTPEQINHIQDIYRMLFIKGHSVSKALQAIKSDIPASEFRDEITSFVESCHRGLMRGLRQRS